MNVIRPALLFIFFSIAIIANSFSQNCGCDKVIPTNSPYYVDGITMNIQPGDTVCLSAGVRNAIAFRNITGTPENPVVIINCGGKAVISTNTSYGIKVDKCKNIKITGTGSAHEYGIEVMGSFQGISLLGYTSDFEIDHVEVHDVTFAGIMAKTDPICNDSTTWRQNFTMKNVNIHHNYIHDTQNGEGFYIGYSFYNGIDCGGFRAYPHDIQNVKVHHNRTYNTACEGIQVGCAVSGCEIYSNIVERYGQSPFDNFQQNGIQIGEGTGGLCYNNLVKSGDSIPGAIGIIVLGLGDNIIYNNLIVKPGATGMFIDERPPATKTDASSGFWVINNTIVSPGSDGIKTYAELVKVNEIKNNIIINPSTGKYINTTGGPGTPVISSGNNFTSMDTSSVKFVDPIAGNYHLKSTSPCVNNAANGARWSIFSDYDGLERPKGTGFDIGALEYNGSEFNNPPIVFAGKDTSIYLPQDSIVIIGTATDNDGSIDTYSWDNLSDTTIIVNRDQLATKVKKLHKGSNLFRLSAVDNGNKTAYDDIVVLVKDANLLPVVNAGKDTVLLFPNTSVVLSGIANDSDGTIVSYLWTQVEGPLSTISGNTSMSPTITNLSSGRSVFRFSVTDNLGAVSTDDVAVLVNYAPTVNAGGDRTVLRTDTIFYLTGTAADQDGTIASVLWTKVSGPAAVITNSTNLSTSVTGFKKGTYLFRLRVTDDKGATTSDNITVTVKSLNVSPTVNVGQDTILTYPLNYATLKGIANDSDGSIASYSWSQVEGSSAVIASNSSVSTTVTNLSTGRSVFRLTVTDDLGATAADDVAITVNYAPTVNAGIDKTVTQTDNSFSLTGTANDQDGTIASILWTKLSGPVATITNGTNLNASVSGFIGGAYVFRLTVTDDRGKSSFDEVQVFVNSVPLVSLGNDRVQTTTQNTTIQATVSDPDGNPITLLWTKISGPSVSMTNTTNKPLYIAGLTWGTYVFRLTVTDSYGASSYDEIILVVDMPPIANAGPDKTINLPQTTTTIDGSGSSDPDGTISYLWIKLTGPYAVLQNNSVPVLTVTDLRAGTYTFRLKVTDNNSVIVQDDMILTVNP